MSTVTKLTTLQGYVKSIDGDTAYVDNTKPAASRAALAAAVRRSSFSVVLVYDTTHGLSTR